MHMWLKFMTVLTHRAFDVWVFLGGAQVFLPLPLPHRFQVIWVKRGNSATCWHLLYADAPPAAQRGQIQCSLSPDTSTVSSFPTSVINFCSLHCRVDKEQILESFPVKLYLLLTIMFCSRPSDMVDSFWCIKFLLTNTVNTKDARYLIFLIDIITDIYLAMSIGW